MAQNIISWTERCEDGVKRETRATVTSNNIKWQFKRKDQKYWEYDSTPISGEWAMLETIMRRRSHRGRGLDIQDHVKKWRKEANA